MTYTCGCVAFFFFPHSIIRYADLCPPQETYRLSNTPAIVVDHESASFRRMMRFVDPNRAPQLPKQNLDINPAHPIIIKLNQVLYSFPRCV